MLETSSGPTDSLAPSLTRSTRARSIAGYGAVVCAIPYLALKIVWLAGGTLGVGDPAMMHEPNIIALNAVTAGMDLVGIGLALTFTERWGARVPAWLVLPPMWIATGLLGRFVIAVPVVTLIELAAPAGAPSAAPTTRQAIAIVQPWVYALVYTEFVGMGIGLMVGFVLYAKARWRAIVEPSTRTATAAIAACGPHTSLATAGAFLAAGAGALNLLWAADATIGLPSDLVAQRTLSSSALSAIDGALALGGAIGIVLLARRVPQLDRSIRFPLAFTWIGSGSLFGWGLWHVINVLGQTALVRGRTDLVLLNFLSLVRLVSGLVIGLTMLFSVAERDAADR